MHIRVAEEQSVNGENREYLVHVGAKVEPDLADAVRRLADDGNRSLSREIRAANRRARQGVVG
jgi:hypothetical protein